ncbi:MAG TPA: hypothetical protein PLB14_03385, partial [Smithellaceae bacterium]|nr:hypothetical protein [Smithellaceae bacterium]
KKELAIGNRPVFIAGSIRSGEEALVVTAIEEIRKTSPTFSALWHPATMTGYHSSPARQPTGV